jgi:chromate transporter
MTALPSDVNCRRLFLAFTLLALQGFAGVLGTFGGIILPSARLALAVSRWGHHRQDWPGVQAFKAGLAPITIGLLFATGWILITSGSEALPSPAVLILTVLSALLVWRTRLHLLGLIVLGACTGAAGWV